MVNHPVGFGGRLRDGGGLIRRLEHDDTAGRDLNLVIVEEPVPLHERQLAGQILRDEILDGDERGIGIGRLEQQALQDLRVDALAVMMERPADRPVLHQVRRLHVDIVALRR